MEEEGDEDVEDSKPSTAKRTVRYKKVKGY
jgi:hypothetical protein